MERSNLHLVEFPFWLKIGSCPPECENKDLTHAIGSNFEGIISSELNGDFCRIKVELDVQKPLRRGIFILASMQGKSWVPFKYENLPGFCFGCGRMGHGIKERKDTLDEFKEFPRDEKEMGLGASRGFRITLRRRRSNITKSRIDDSQLTCRPGAIKILYWNVRGAEGTKSGLCLAGKEVVDIILRSFSRNYIDMMVESKEVDLK
ncbi:hypothetical protein Gotri_022860 [Gossypium trilobum]|uniref:Zinc knuckle CX2CX4HX4C domain-containing protein n=1 Tax=Gossypium trilobum TaxID=34281 RepID=A0A7J9DHF5_9ROSI|nr:hypothetical protein [Gossypium trilobum]